MNITGKLVQILPTELGESQRGPWTRGGFVIETGGDYPKRVAFQVFGENRVAQYANMPIGTLVTVDFFIEAHEHNGKWYNNVCATRIMVPAPVQPVYAQPQQPQQPYFGGYGGSNQPAY